MTMLKDLIDRLRVNLIEAIDPEDRDPEDTITPEERKLLEPYDELWGTLRYRTSEDDESIGASKPTFQIGMLYNVPYSKLQAAFGEPSFHRDGFKSKPTWKIEFADYLYVEIFEKSDKLNASEVTDWIIAGEDHDHALVERVKLVLDGNGKRG